MKKMTALELMLCVKNERIQIYYHRDTKVFDLMPVSQFEPEHIDWDADISDSCKNNVAFLTYQEIDHKDVMRFLYENVYMTKNREKNCSTVNGKPPTSFSRPHFFEIIVCS